MPLYLIIGRSETANVCFCLEFDVGHSPEYREQNASYLSQLIRVNPVINMWSTVSIGAIASGQVIGLDLRWRGRSGREGRCWFCKG